MLAFAQGIHITAGVLVKLGLDVSMDEHQICRGIFLGLLLKSRSMKDAPGQ